MSLEHVKLSESSQRQKAACGLVPSVCSVHNRPIRRDRKQVPRAARSGGRGAGSRCLGVQGLSFWGWGGDWNETRVAAVQHRECTGSHRTAYFKVANFMVRILPQFGAGRGWSSHLRSREQWPPRHPSQGAPAPRPLTQGAATSSAHKFRGRLSPSADHKWQLAPARPQQLRLSPQPRGTSRVKIFPACRLVRT